MASRQTILTQSERQFWRECYRDDSAKLIGKYGVKARVRRVGDDAAAHADEAVRQLRMRQHLWGRQ